MSGRTRAGARGAAALRRYAPRRGVEAAAEGLAEGELFFDLAFVASVAQLSGRFAESYDPAGAPRFVFAFVVPGWLGSATIARQTLRRCGFASTREAQAEGAVESRE